MLGTDHEPGIYARTLDDLFRAIEETSNDMEYEVSMSYLEVSLPVPPPPGSAKGPMGQGWPPAWGHHQAVSRAAPHSSSPTHTAGPTLQKWEAQRREATRPTSHSKKRSKDLNSGALLTGPHSQTAFC